MVTIKLKELSGIGQGLNQILEVKNAKAKLLYKFTKLAKFLDKESEIFEAAKKDLQLKYGKKNDVGELIIEDDKIQLDDPKAFSEEFNELLDTKIEVPFEPIDFKEFEEFEGIGTALYYLDSFIIDNSTIEDEFDEE